MSKDRKKRREGKKDPYPKNSNESPPSDPDNSNNPPKVVEDIPMDTLGDIGDQPPNVDNLLSSLRQEALGPVPPPPSASCSVPREDDRSPFVNSQLDNRYSNLSLPPFIVFIEVKNPDSSLTQQDRRYIGNLHPLSISKRICNQFNNMKISNIKRVGRNLLSVSFDSFQQANSFVTSRSSLPKGWVSYVPNYKIFRTGVIRNVDRSLTLEDIQEGISWPDSPLKIVKIERMKYRPRDSDVLLDSSTVKITFESVLLPEFMY